MTEARTKEIYLGDGVYASFDGHHIVLRAPRDATDHYVFLEPAVMLALMRYRNTVYNITDTQEDTDAAT